MKLTKVLIGLVIVALIGSASGLALAHKRRAAKSIINKIERRGTLVVAAGIFEPWVTCSTQGTLIGYEIDLAKKIAEDMGVEVEFVPVQWRYIQWGLLADQFDIIVSYGVNAERALRVNYSSPHQEFGISIVVNTKLTVTKLAELNRSSVTIAARKGATSQTFVENMFPQTTVLTFETAPEIQNAVVAGTAHAAAVYEPNQVEWLEDYPDTLYSPFEQTFDKIAGAIALRKGDADAVNFFNSWVATNKSNGWLQERHQYWFNTREWVDQIAADASQCQ